MTTARLRKKNPQHWWDISKRDQRVVYQWLLEMKSQRKFAWAMRNALLLMYDFVHGRLDHFKTLFPDLAEQLREEGRREALQKNAVDERQIVLDLLAELEQRRMNVLPSDETQPFQRLPLEFLESDDDILEVTQAASDEDVADNLLASMSAFDF